MDTNVITVFFGMALTVAFTKLVEAQNIAWDTWFIFFYFVFRRISYYMRRYKICLICRRDV